ncbi:MAG TPA: alpha/beta family hydrolase [Candidatus Bathyarchaeia archaeon]
MSGVRVRMEKAKVTLDRGGEMSLMYGVPDEFPGDPTCLVFAHGAGGPMYSPFLTYFHTELAKHGFLTVKFNFPYMEARKKTPDKKDVLEAAYRKIVEEVKSSQYKPDRIFIGGKSMGGRIASQVVAGGVDVNGLFFLGYPLHPPGRLDRLRDEHLYKITRPMLFVSGTRDSFGTRELLEKVLSRLGSKASVHWVEEGDHSFNTPEGKSAVPKTYETVVRVLVDWAQTSA